MYCQKVWLLDSQTGIITGQPETAGSYHVVVSATNSVGSSDSPVAWGYNSHGQTDVPVGLSNVVAIAAGSSQRLALVASPGFVFRSQTVGPGTDVTLAVPASEGQPAWLDWYHNGMLVHSGNTLSLPDIKVSDLGTYVATARFSFGQITRATIELSFDSALRFLPGSIRVSAAGQLSFTLTGPIGQTVQLLASDDFRNWDHVGSATNTTGTVEFPEVNPNGERRFYRAQQLD